MNVLAHVQGRTGRFSAVGRKAVIVVKVLNLSPKIRFSG